MGIRSISKDANSRASTIRGESRWEHDGSLTVLADSWNGKPLNAPNDIVVHPDGGIWFTDPGYGSMSNYEGHKHELQLKEAIYRIDPKTLKMQVVTDEGFKPNGLCFSPDYKLLYVADTGGPEPRGIDVYKVVESKQLRKRKRFCSMEYDGKKVARMAFVRMWMATFGQLPDGREKVMTVFTYLRQTGRVSV